MFKGVMVSLGLKWFLIYSFIMLLTGAILWEFKEQFWNGLAAL